MARFGRTLGRHPMPLPQSEDSETDEYNVIIDQDRQYEKIPERGSTTTTGTGTSSRSSSNHGPAMFATTNAQLQNAAAAAAAANVHRNAHLMATLSGACRSGAPTHYAESAIYKRGTPGQTGSDVPAPLIPESQMFMAADSPSWKPEMTLYQQQQQQQQQQHAMSMIHHPHHLSHMHHQSQSSQNTTVLSTLDSSGNSTAGSAAPVYESTCLMRTPSGSLYIPSGKFL